MGRSRFRVWFEGCGGWPGAAGSPVAAVLWAGLLLSGCNAQFVDLRPESERVTTPLPPAAGEDGGSGVDLAGPGDGGTAPTAMRFAAGMFEGRAGHAGTGGAALYRLGGAVELRFDAAFAVSGVPAPAIYLTSRADMGGSIDTQADVKIGTLTAFSGAQSIAVPAGAEVGRRNVFIYCQPFRVEVAKAPLQDVAQ